MINCVFQIFLVSLVKLPNLAAQCRAVRRNLSVELTVAPFLINKSASFAWPMENHIALGWGIIHNFIIKIQRKWKATTDRIWRHNAVAFVDRCPSYQHWHHFPLKNRLHSQDLKVKQNHYETILIRFVYLIKFTHHKWQQNVRMSDQKSLSMNHSHHFQSIA